MAIHEYRDDPTSDDPAVSSIEPIAVNHRTECPVGRTSGNLDKGRTELSAECRAAGCVVGYMHVSYVGRVASLRERNGYDDSDFFATVWDKSTGETREIIYATTRGWTYWNGAVVDLSPEDRAEYERQREEKRRAAREDAERREAEASAKVPHKGTRVRVISKRSKVPHGTTGVVFWFGESSYGRPRYGVSVDARTRDLFTSSELILQDLENYRVGIRTDDGSKVFCAATCIAIEGEE